MNDTIKVVIDSTRTALTDSLAIKDSSVVNKGQSFLENFAVFMDSPWFYRFFLPVVLLIVGWILRNYYDKYFAMKPRLYLKMGRSYYEQRTQGFHEDYRISWRYECTLKNNSKYDAYNISIKEIKPQKEEDIIISNKRVLQESFPLYNHLSNNSAIEFEIKKTINVDPNVFIKTIVENGKTIMLPGSKIHNPESELMPSVLKDIKLVVFYENEKGKKFYCKFSKLNDKETNKIMGHNPYIFKKMI